MRRAGKRGCAEERAKLDGAALTPRPGRGGGGGGGRRAGGGGGYDVVVIDRSGARRETRGTKLGRCPRTYKVLMARQVTRPISNVFLQLFARSLKRELLFILVSLRTESAGKSCIKLN